MLSVPFIENASTIVIRSPTNSDFGSQKVTSVYTKNPVIIIKVTANIVKDPASVFLVHPILNSGLLMLCPTIAANPSPYPITAIPHKPINGLFIGPKVKSESAKSETA